MTHATRIALFLLVVSTTGAAFAANDVPVPSQCTSQVNQKLADLIAQQSARDVDNIMACGVATQNTQVRRGGPHGSHHLTTIAVQLPGGSTVKVQIVTNDDLDGPVTARTDDPVFAYGQGYIVNGKWAAGIHDTHCSTHRGADNGWVVVAGVKTPSSCSNQR